MDILLAHGYYLALDAAEQRVMRPHPPLGLLYLSSHLKAKGMRVGIFDATFRTLDDFSQTLDRERPPIVGIAVNLMTKRNALAMIALARQRGARVVLGGPDPPHHAKSYLDAGADGIYIEGPRDRGEIERVGRAFEGVPLATSVLERGGVTPWLAPKDLRDLGYAMILYPTTVLFRLVKTIESALSTLREGEPVDQAESVDMRQFEDLIELKAWGEIETRFPVGETERQPQKPS